MKIIIFGASGSGTTTLGRSLAERTSWRHLDADDYYWAKTTIPFQTKLPLEERSEQLRRAFQAQAHVIVSGSLVTWGGYWEGAFDYGIFLKLPVAIRMARLRAREVERYGPALANDSQLQAQSGAFLAWAAQYDDPEFSGRSITQHRSWIQRMTCPVLEIVGDLSNEERIATVLKGLPVDREN